MPASAHHWSLISMFCGEETEDVVPAVLPLYIVFILWLKVVKSKPILQGLGVKRRGGRKVIGKPLFGKERNFDIVDLHDLDLHDFSDGGRSRAPGVLDGRPDPPP